MKLTTRKDSKIKLEKCDIGDDESSGVHKITITAHFQLPLPKKDDPSTFKFKKASSFQKMAVRSDRFQSMSDIYAAVSVLSRKNIKCGTFDGTNPSIKNSILP